MGNALRKNKSYGKIGYDKAKAELEQWFCQQMETLKQQSTEPIEVNEDDDDGQIWITLY